MLKFVTALIFSSLLSGCYLLKQGLSFNALINTRTPVDQVIADNLRSGDPQKIAEAKKLLEVKKMLSFAEKMNFKIGDAYTYYIKLKEPQISYVVQAAPWNSMTLKTWWFPIVGSVPYLGFYDLEDARQEALRLKKDDFDVSIGGVGAFSSLGWFSDPILSTMIDKDRDKIAETLFHELAHRTMWISGDADFNEQFAEFIGYQMATAYLSEENDSDSIKALKARNEDELIFSNWIRHLQESLNNLYAKTSGREKKAILAEKAAIIAEHLKPPLKPSFKTYDYAQRDDWNNASIMASALYQFNKKEWQNAYTCSKSKNLKEFMVLLDKKLKISHASPQQELQSFCL